MINFDLEKKSVDKIGVEIFGINNCVIKNVCVYAYMHINTHVNIELKKFLVLLRNSFLSSLHVPFLFILNLISMQNRLFLYQGPFAYIPDICFKDIFGFEKKLTATIKIEISFVFKTSIENKASVNKKTQRVQCCLGHIDHGTKNETEVIAKKHTTPGRWAVLPSLVHSLS